MTITIQHVRAVGYCAKGAREFCDKYGFDWSDFLHNGVSEERLLETGDAMAEAIVKAAKAGR